MIYHAFIQMCIVYVCTYHLVTWLGGLLFQYYLCIVDPVDIADSSDSRALLAMVRNLAAVCARELLAWATIAQPHQTIACPPCTPKQYRLQPFLTPGMLVGRPEHILIRGAPGKAPMVRVHCKRRIWKQRTTGVVVCGIFPNHHATLPIKLVVRVRVDCE